MALSPRFEDALVFAARLPGDVRKGTTIPYVSHVLGVASLGLEHGAGGAIAALLHDTVQDDTGDPEAIRLEICRRYGGAVLAIVDGCTDSRIKPKRERKESGLRRRPRWRRSSPAAAARAASPRTTVEPFGGLTMPGGREEGC